MRYRRWVKRLKRKGSAVGGFPGGSVVKNLPAVQEPQETPCLIPGSGRSPGGGHGNPLQYSCLENPMDRGAWQAIVYGVARVRHDLVIEQEEEPPNMEG